MTKDHPEGFRSRLHRIAPESPVTMEIDQTGGEIIITAIDHLIRLGETSLFSICNLLKEPILHQKRPLKNALPLPPFFGGKDHPGIGEEAPHEPQVHTFVVDQ